MTARGSKAVRVASLAQERRAGLNLDPKVEDALRDVEDELRAQYSDAFLALTSAINEQASALNRIQATLELLVRAIQPTLASQLPGLPPAIRVAADGEAPDLASAIVVADPVGAGYVLSQQALAETLGVSQPDVSILVKPFKLADDGECAIVVRKGKQRDMVNYHRRAIARFRELVASPPSGMSKAELAALDRVRRKLLRGDTP